MYSVIYDATCNLCVTFVRLLKQLDGGARFTYVPMQDEAALGQWGITAADCEQGMILVDHETPTQRWQGTAAAEEIGRLLPMGEAVVAAYRALPGMKPLGDRVYDYVRDNRYTLFGRCDADNCRI
ncbi:MAG: DUF393 domain-containing protein [Leptolyngbyaceae cyanobacterium T60_A2020_046]|nr:DUF393 domain-containing protein [Leptolyngbyaceae cyanobacterium T60_A2020_046]